MDSSPPPAAPVAPLTPQQIAALPHDDQGPHLLISIWTLISLATIFLCLRMYCKWFRHRGLWWDDYVLIAAWLCSLTECSLLTTATVRTGYGKHSWDVIMQYPIQDLAFGFRLLQIAGTFSITAAIWSKTSFAITLLRLTEGKIKILVWFIIISMNIAMGISALLPWVQCTPVEKSWNIFMRGGECWDPSIILNYDIFSSAYSAAMDITLTLLPWKLILGLNMKKKERIGVALAMSCGIFAGITAIVKTAKMKSGMNQSDLANGIDLYIWGNAETASSIIAACIPILRVLVKDVRSTARRYYGSSRAGNYATGGPGGVRKSLGGSRNNTVVVTAGRSRMTHNGQKMDDWSEKSILDDSSNKSPSHGHIMQTNEVAVEYQDRREGDVVEYQLENLHPV